MQLGLTNLDGVDKTNWGYLKYNIIVVGSEFPGISNTETSTFIFGRVGPLEDVLGLEKKKLKFETQSGNSPFNYVHDGAAFGGGCGMTFEDSKRRIVETGGCQFSQTYVMIAGFAIITSSGNLGISALRVDDSGNFFPTDDSSLYAKSSSADVDFGVQISIVNETGTAKNKVQYSFVHVGIREYTAAYP